MIKVLEKIISDKIAAGEVIERPVSIVKELVENSIDSQATSITIDIQNGGKTMLRVTDNGCGIPKDEVEIAFLRHATSKIESVSDLNCIDTLGFRGEALASIAAVTRTELITKTKDEKIATRIIIHGGEVIKKEDTGAPDGTTIIVNDLFYNTPARLKFLKNDNTESTLIIKLLSEMALCYKDIKFKLINNGKVIFSTLGDGNRLNTIIRVYSDIDSKNLIPIESNDAEMSISGYISSPAMSKNNRGTQIYFVNGRVVDSKVIDKAIDLGYKERLFEGRHPIAFLFLNTNPETLDVNIHPNKREVRFDDEQLVISFISNVIVSSLANKDAVVDASNIFKDKGLLKIDSKPFIKAGIQEKDESNQVDIKHLLSTFDNPIDNFSLNEDELYIEPKHHICIDKPVYKPFNFNELEVTGTIFDTYITALDNDNFYLIDQHACQERILYEKFVNEYDSSEKIKQQLLTPIVINVSITENSNTENWLNSLCQLGFSIDEFGQNTYRISEIPMFMTLKEANDFVIDFVNNIDNSIDFRNTVVINKLITKACKASIKAHDKISIPEIKVLFNDLSNCVNPYSCPHGRPTAIKLSQYEIERMFKRV